MMLLSVMILAGGQSRRMGQDKALLPGRDGQPLLCQTVQTAWQVAPNVVVVTPWPDRYRALLAEVRSPTYTRHHQPTVQLIQEPLLPNEPNPQGPLVGFSKGWESLSSPWCLLLACDLPYLESSVLRDWWQQLTTQPDSLAVASLTPRFAPMTVEKGCEPPACEPPACEPPAVVKDWEPLCGFYHRRGLPGLRLHLAMGGRSFQGWLANVPVSPFQGVPKKMLFNCNTPEDWGKVQF